MDNFISIIQGGPKERRQMLRHLFHQINRVFRPNEEADMERKDPSTWRNWGKVMGPGTPRIQS